MKKKLFAVLMVLIMCSTCFTACTDNNEGQRGLSSYQYDDAGKYTPGGAALTSAVNNLDIDWVSGEIEIVYHDERTIVFSETSNREEDEQLAMRYWLDGDTLRIKFAESGNWNFGDLHKTLTVMLPADLVLNELEIDTVSANLKAHRIAAKRADMDTVSGWIDIEEAAVSQSFNADTTSGDITAMFAGSLGELEIDTVSGKTQISVDQLGEFEINSTSGAVSLSAANAPASGEIGTVSGDVELILPETAEFTVEINTVSGEFDSEFSLAKNGDRYSCGSGACRYEVETTSGNISFRLQ
ncbi:MAG: DUF4097 family beta strand repeat protein [Lachnospiraceae bacterium]|nr:DUF4097 family beta strand repeat protein [Lachnospiraceae bacterium]